MCVCRIYNFKLEIGCKLKPVIQINRKIFQMIRFRISRCIKVLERSVASIFGVMLKNYILNSYIFAPKNSLICSMEFSFKNKQGV
jgi:hypothetical protein